MKKQYYADPNKFAAGIATFLVCAILSATMLSIRYFIPGFVFFLIALLFLSVSVLYGAVVSIDQEGITRSFFGLFPKRFLWREITEIGVIGTKVLNRADPDKTGTLYLYFSPEALDDEKRFALGLAWPPKDLIYLLYNKERMDCVQLQWAGKIHTFNTGNLHIG